MVLSVRVRKGVERKYEKVNIALSLYRVTVLIIG